MIFEYVAVFRYAIDAYLQVYELQTGARISDLGAGSRLQYTLVKLTYDGQYAIWADERYVRVARVQPRDDDNNGRSRRLPTQGTNTCSGKCIGYICTHEKTVSLTTLDYGYLIVIGREDGHVITARIVDGLDQLPPKFKPLTLKERTDTLLDHIFYPDGLIATFDPCFRAKPRRLENDTLPRLGEEVHKELERRAKIPHAVIKTPSAGNLYASTPDCGSLSAAAARNRRGSSPVTFFTSPRHKESSPTSSASGSPSPARRPPLGKLFSPQSPRTLPRRNPKTPIKHKSPSLTDLFAHGASNKPPKVPSKSPGAATMGGPFTLHKAVQNTGALAMAVTDVAPVSTPDKPDKPSGILYKVKKTLHLSGGKERRHSGEVATRRLSGDSSASSDLNGNASDMSDDAKTAEAARRKRCSSASLF